MKKLAMALTLASSLALPVAAVRGQESSDSERQQQQSQRSQQQGSQQSNQSRSQSAQRSGQSEASQSSQRRQQQQRQQQQSTQDQEQQQQQSGSQRNVLLEGQVIDVDTLDLQGHDYQHVFATVRSDHTDRTFLVDLGTQRELRGIQAQPGQQMSVTGWMATFKGNPVIIAREVQQGDRSASITRASQRDSVAQSVQQQQMQDCPLCAAKASNQQQQQQGQQGQQRSSSQQTAQRQSQQGQLQQQQSISGTLIDARSIQLRGQQDRHVLAKIQTDAGRTVIADLGPRRNLRDFQPSRGSEIQVSGSRGTINGKSVLLAERASTDDQSINIQRSGSTSSSQQMRQSQQRQQQRSQQQQRQTAQIQRGQGGSGAVQGTLVSTVAMDFGTESPTYVLGTLQTQNGQRVLVDLGTLQDIQDAQLRLGEELRAQGRVTQLNGVPVVIARQIEDDGQTITIDRQSPDVEQTVRSQSSSSQSSSSRSSDAQRQ